jgi:hypothetical protein
MAAAMAVDAADLTVDTAVAVAGMPAAAAEGAAVAASPR